MNKPIKNRKPRTPEAIFFDKGLKGAIMYSTKAQKDIKAFATWYKRKTATEILIVVSTKLKPTASRITKITLL